VSFFSSTLGSGRGRLFAMFSGRPFKCNLLLHTGLLLAFFFSYKISHARLLHDSKTIEEKNTT
jgi:hypothetical protein